MLYPYVGVVARLDAWALPTSLYEKVSQRWFCVVHGRSGVDLSQIVQLISYIHRVWGINMIFPRIVSEGAN
jgi:hypothetical protein